MTMEYEAVLLTTEARAFLQRLDESFRSGWEVLIMRRASIQKRLDERLDPHELLRFDERTRDLREDSSWIVGHPVQKYGRVDLVTKLESREDIEFALNEGAEADGLQCDFDDAFCPVWSNTLKAHGMLRDVVLGKIRGKKLPELWVRPRSLHMIEAGYNDFIAALFDFGLYCLHNAQRLVRIGQPIRFYLPKIEHYGEAEWWRSVFEWTENELDLARGTIKCIVLIENIFASYCMDEILFYMRPYCIGLNAGIFDYVASILKTFRCRTLIDLPDRGGINFSQLCMRTYRDLLIETCSARGALATTGMAPHLNLTEAAVESVYKAKLAEALAGSVGALVAHPNYLAAARRGFADGLEGGKMRKEKINLRSNFNRLESDLSSLPSGISSPEGEVACVRVLFSYCTSFLQHRGTAVVDGKLEDMATAEISRGLLWHWYKAKRIQETRLDDLIRNQLNTHDADDYQRPMLKRVCALVKRLATSPNFVPFITDELMPHAISSCSNL